MTSNNILILIGVIALLILIFPVKNWLVIRGAKKNEQKWMRWLKEKPSLEEYCQKHQQDLSRPKCDYCGAERQLPSLEMVISNNVQYGLINNTFDKYLHFKTYICSGCGTELYRKSYVE